MLSKLFLVLLAFSTLTVQFQLGLIAPQAQLFCTEGHAVKHQNNDKCAINGHLRKVVSDLKATEYVFSRFSTLFFFILPATRDHSLYSPLLHPLHHLPPLQQMQQPPPTAPNHKLSPEQVHLHIDQAVMLWKS